MLQAMYLEVLVLVRVMLLLLSQIDSIENNNIMLKDAETVTGIKTFNEEIIGDLIGDVTGNLTGDVTGNLTGDVTGNVSGSSGSCTGNSNVQCGQIQLKITI